MKKEPTSSNHWDEKLRGTTQIARKTRHLVKVCKGTCPRFITEHSKSGKRTDLRLFAPTIASLKQRMRIFFYHSKYIIYHILKKFKWFDKFYAIY